MGCILYFWQKIIALMDYVITADGSKTIFNAQIGEHYHSKHGALQEAQHVFLKSGLQFSLANNDVESISILEVGFGTGLNFILTADYCLNHSIHLDYCGIEAFPLSSEIVEQTEYNAFVSDKVWDAFLTNYDSCLKHEQSIIDTVNLHIAHQKVLDFTTDKQFDVIYFDAFAAIHQPEMWTEETLGHITKFLKPGGVFVTYAITGNLKRTMKSLGFSIEKAPGAPGKREMLRAIKL